MHDAQSTYALSIDQTAASILANGHKRTAIVEGHMGTGKSSLLGILQKKLTARLKERDGKNAMTPTPCYFDCTTKDLGDITVPNVVALQESDFVRYSTNEELGLHLDNPVIIMIDEYGKANQAVKNSLLRLMLERKLGGRELHPDSIVFSTSNLGAEGVGDLLPPHALNRLTSLIMRKPTAMEWVEWGISNELDPAILAFARDNEQLFDTFENIKDPEENPYIYHPKATGRKAFVTCRSLEAASDWLKVRDELDDQSLTASLIGTIGSRAAMDLAAYVSLADQLPSLDSIKNTPAEATVPKDAAAVCMVVFRTLTSIEPGWVDAWVQYMDRLSTEAQALFINGVRAKDYSRQSIVLSNKKIQQWARDNNDLFTADK